MPGWVEGVRKLLLSSSLAVCKRSCVFQVHHCEVPLDSHAVALPTVGYSWSEHIAWNAATPDGHIRFSRHFSGNCTVGGVCRLLQRIVSLALHALRWPHELPAAVTPVLCMSHWLLLYVRILVRV